MSPYKEETTYSFDAKDLPGATRIGHVWLHVPPINIHYNNPKFNDSMLTMRQRGSNFIKSGRGLWSFDMDMVFSGTDQINGKLAKILAMLRRTPFLNLYNETVYKLCEYSTGIVDVPHHDIPIMVTGYTLNTEPSLPDTVTLRLAFMVYNSKPLVEQWQFYRQDLDSKGAPIYNVPASSIEDSNLWRQYVEGLIKPIDSGFMFAGELDDFGTRTNADRAAHPPDPKTIFISRNDPASGVLRNGDAVKTVGRDWGSAEAKEAFHIGYHVTTIMEAFDLGLGAYKSRRSGQWIGTLKDLKEDLSKHLGIEIAEDASSHDVTDIILKNMDSLYDLPTCNVGNRYIKIFSIMNGANLTIDGITVRRTFSPSVLPIVSAPVPTAQYVGGANSTITLSVVTTSEDAVRMMAAVDKSIETDARSKMRHAGSNLIYVSNDMANLNGIFTVVNETMDAQSVPENPGTFIVTWMFNEQTETVKTLDSKFTEKRSFKKRILRKLLEYYGPRWSYSKSQKSDDDVRFTFDSIHPSYTETLLIPSMIRLVRNAFIRWLKEDAKWDIQKTIKQSSVIAQAGAIPLSAGLAITKKVYDALVSNEALQTDVLFGEYIGKDDPTAPMVVDPNIPNQGNPQTNSHPANYGKKVETVRFSRQAAYNQIWKMMTGQESETDHPLWSKFLIFMKLQSDKDPDFDFEELVLKNRGTPNAAEENRRAYLLSGAIQTILNGDCRRFEMMIRSPKLLRWELSLIGIKTSATDQPVNRGGVFGTYSNRWGQSYVLRQDMINLFESFKTSVKSTLNIDIDIISGWRPRSTTEELQQSGAPAVDWENSSHTFGVGIDFTVVNTAGHAVSKSSISAATWTQIGAIARKSFFWGGDITDPATAAEEVNHIAIKNYSRNMAEKFRREYAGFYFSGESLLQFGITNRASAFTGDYLSLDLIDGTYISCYQDLGIPFPYQPEDREGRLLRKANGTLYPPEIMTNPTFYMREYSPFISDSTVKSKIEVDDNIHNDAKSLSKMTGAFPGLCMVVDKLRGVVSNDLHVGGQEEETATSSASSNKKDIEKTEVQRALDDVQKEADKKAKILRNQGLVRSGTPLNFGTFKSVNDLFLSNSLVKSMGPFGSETSPMVIAEAEYEHRLFRSTFKDFNADIDKTLPELISSARENIRNNTKYFSMTRAYPTYKLYFREENSPEWFLFDNFYDYRSVESIRFYKEKASPSSVIHLVLNNHNGALTDLQARFAQETHAPDKRNSEDRIINAFTNKAIKSLFLQPGTQIQLKIGYESNPADMPTVFNGFVTEVSGGEKFEIVCQSYGAELFSEANVGSFLGWFCSPKSFIWWMLLDSKVKHLGRLVQASILPSTATDYLDGPAFDDNIYIDLEMEPGKWRLLQAYNADNMTKWDALQDIAAAHPGFICQVVPFDDRETVFFGRPDDWYKFTQDLGTTRSYPNLDLDALPLLGGGWNSLTKPFKNTGKSVREYFQQEMAKDEDPLVGKKPINYLQWMKIKDKLDEAFNKWRSNFAEGTAGRTVSLLMDYCKTVEVLATVGADGSTSNVQFWLGTGEAPKDEAKPDNRNFGLNSMEETPSATPPPRIDQNDAEVARLAEEIIKNQPASKLNAEMLEHLDPVVKSSVLRSLHGRTIPLLTILRDPDIQKISYLLSDARIQTTLALEQKDIQFFENFQSVVSRYDLTKDEKKIKEELSKLETDIPGLTDQADIDQALIQPMKRIYERYGIESPIVILCWYKLAGIWAILLNELLPIPGEQKTGRTSARNPMDLSYSGSEADNKHSVSFEGYIPFHLSVRHTTNDITVAKNNNVITFSGPIFRTDLKTHIMFRNILLQNLVDLNDEFHKAIAEFGHSPIQQRFRKYHLVTGYEHIVSNDIRSNFMEMWNRVRVKYKRHDFMDYYVPFLPQLIFGDKLNNEFEIQAGQTLDDRITREITMPVENAKTVSQARNYATSILAEGVRNMYGGRLTILGNPEIKPYDVVYIHDDYTRMYGPIEVKSVTHVMSAESGFVTIIEPHAYVDVLSQEIGPASAIKEIFDIAMIAMVIWPGFGMAGNAAKTAAAGGIRAFTKKAALEAGAKAFSKSKTLGNQLFKYLGKRYSSMTKAFEVATREATSTRAVKLLTDKKVVNGEARLLAEINRVRAASTSNIPQITKIKQADLGEMNSALKTILGATQGSPAALEVDTITALGGAVGAAKVASTGAAKAGKGALGLIVDKETWATITGISFVNMMKTLAVGAPIAYYQMFAGMDDPTYACPLRITPLSLVGQPFQAGLDGITHRWGIWEHVAGEWRRFSGSVNTVAGALEEFYSSIAGLNL